MTPTAIIIIGVSGCGKSSLAQSLTARFLEANLPVKMLEGDEYHPLANIEKMRAGEALNDLDREPWLQQLNDELRNTLAQGQYAILACSALKQKYRTLLSQSIFNPVWIHLHGSFELIEARLKARQHKYMPTSLLRSQFDTLEAPTDAITLMVDASVAALTEQTFEQLKAQQIVDASTQL
jgi:carbohydrate kinase (thermoresistant glucokinase family)